MANKMLIDAAHAEETRVVVLRGSRIEEFDFESATRKQLRGNIYLAKVTRVEPSLQAAFVDYGGNRHGFLAFSEIHPDYYQIPVADRQALLEEEAAADQEDLASEDDQMSADGGAIDDVPDEPDDDAKDDKNGDSGAAEKSGSESVAQTTEVPQVASGDADGDEDDGAQAADNGKGRKSSRAKAKSAGNGAAGDEDNGDDTEDGEKVESVGAEDALAEVPRRRRQRERRYKIQEVIKRRQIILVQVVKEERGTKGAALTTYLSLAGRYCVLMPNTARGGGISRKITNPSDRRRLKDVAGNLNVPDGTGLIVRTAGAQRTKAEIKRDFEYLLRLWETVRDLTLDSSAPSLVYEEGSLIKRSLRDLYNKDVDEVLIEGDDGYKEAKAFMRMLMPSHAKNIKAYKETQPLFMRNQIESQLDSLFQPRVTLKSGGYLVINQTEALVSIDVNSGRSTREHNIEDTALKTNLEAADEVARQLRLRDLAGLIVIDFIDMEERRNNRSVERKLKDCLKHERARIQVGRISHFGLLEMSRQRMRSGLVEGSTQACEFCHGTGFIRSVESAALFVLRAIEEHVLKGKADNLTVQAASDIALYILNQKREHLLAIQTQFGISIFIEANPELRGTMYEISRAAAKSTTSGEPRTVQLETAFSGGGPETEDEEPKGRRRRRRRRRGRKRDDQAATADTEQAAAGDRGDHGGDGDRGKQDDEDKPKSRRGRRGRGRRSKSDEETGDKAPVDAAADGGDGGDAGGEDQPKRGARRGRRRKPREETAAAETNEARVVQQADGPDLTEPPAEAGAGKDVNADRDTDHPADVPADKPKRKPRKTAKPADKKTAKTTKDKKAKSARKPKASGNGADAGAAPDEAPGAQQPAAETPPPSAPESPAEPQPRPEPAERRTGWWQKRS
jgi:ribonuclease E